MSHAPFIPIPKCAPNYNDRDAHCWHWTGRVHKQREDGHIEHECRCCYCGRVGLAIPFIYRPDHGMFCPQEVGVGIGSAEVVAW